VAVASLSFACATDPQVAKRKYFESGNQYFQNKKYAEATVQYNNALRQDPNPAQRGNVWAGGDKLQKPSAGNVIVNHILPRDPVWVTHAGVVTARS